MSKIKVNFVIGDDKSSQIFTHIFRRFVEHPEIDLAISSVPIDDYDVYHYHRVQMSDDIRRNSVATVHHDLDDPDPFVRLEYFLPKYEKLHKIICLNSIQKEKLQLLGYQNCEVIPHGYDDVVLKKKTFDARDSSKKFCIGFISKRYLRRFKGEARLMQLIDHLDPNQVSFLLVGDGRAEEAAYLRSYGFDVTLHEYLPYKLFQDVYESIDVLLMVSLFEGGPANIPEAVATGTPMLCSRVGMVADMLVDGVNGHLLSNDPKADADLIHRLANNEEQCFDHLSRTSISTTMSPTWDEVIDMHIDLYKRIASEANVIVPTAAPAIEAGFAV